MKNLTRKSVIMTLVVAALLGMITAFAHTTVYAQSAPNFVNAVFRAEPNVQVNVYNQPGGSHVGWFSYDSGDVRILATRMHNSTEWFYVRYALFAGGHRDAWVRRSTVIIGSRSPIEVAFHRNTPVNRNSSMRTRFGEAWSGQSRGYAWAIGERNGNVQVIFRLAAGGFRIGWATPNTMFPIDNDSAPPRGFNPVWPTQGGHITSGRTHPSGNHHSRRHAEAIDINVPVGTPVFAVESGYIISVRNLGNTSFGRYIEIRHDNGAISLYAHLSRQDVQVNQRVARGQQIALSGYSGNVIGNGHLHFELSNSTRDRMADFFPGR
ncbi:MAG: M23 family metallopeptidase [Oscillospiraceae bacterium]|nr:M23 family metallopeptidase [Oscillospiraceae bacterium]